MPVLVINGENITIKTNVSDYNIDSMWYNITNASDPEVTRAEGLMEMISNSYFLANYTTDLIAGDYYVTVHANDSYGNKANASSGSFRIEVPVNFTIQFLDYNGSVDSVSSIRIFYNGSEMIRNQISGSVSWMEDIIPFGLWDIIVESNSLQQSLNVTLMDANLSSNITKTMMLDLNVSATGTDPPNGIRSFSGIVAVNTTIGFNNALINMSFNITGSSNRSHTSVYACHSWNISTRSCSGSWVNASSNASFDMSRNTTSISVTGFSAFGITQDEYCGDGVCDNDESCSSCSSDCGSCPNDDDNDPGSNPGSTPSSSVTSSIEITTYPGVVIAKPGSVKDFLVGVRNNGYANLTRVGIGLLTNCSSCSLSSSPGEIDLERGETASFTASLSVGDQVTGQYSLDISAHSGLAAGDSVESIIAILQCFDGERRCIGNATQQCSDNEWSFVDECDHGCESGQCKPEPVPVVSCTPNQTKCSDNSTVNICTDEGDQWVFGEKCAFGCIDGSCVIAGSAPLNIMVVITNISIVIIVLTSVIVLWIYLSKRGIDNEWKALEDKYRGF